MANYNHTMDLMAFIGARQAYLKVRDRNEGETDEEYAKVPVLEYSCIPNVPNNIIVSDDTSNEHYRNFSGKHARMSFAEFDLPNDSKLKQAARTRLMQSGTPETPHNVPCRELRPRYTKEFQESARKRYETQIKKEHPEWSALQDQGTNVLRGTERNALTRAINAKFPYSLGNGYLRESLQQPLSPYPQVQTNVVAQPTYEQAIDPFSAEIVNDELPF